MNNFSEQNELDTILDYYRKNEKDYTPRIGSPLREVHNFNGADYYSFGGIEVIDVVKAKMSSDEFRGFLKGSVIKYICREGLKSGTDDLKKSLYYLKKLISHRRR